ncbi:MAG: hypothetical protein PVSMB8_00320 [Vulcanimicrobiaceae bacterium]
MAYVKLDTCPCGRCSTSWSRRLCHYKEAQHARQYVKVENWTAKHRESMAIGDEWNRANDEEGRDAYTLEDEREWHRATYLELTVEEIDARIMKFRPAYFDTEGSE